MHKIEIKNLQELYNKLHSHNEETIKVLIIVGFLKSMGFKEEFMDFEFKTFENKRIVDITIHNNTNSNPILFIEAKNAYDELTLSDQTQLVNYLNDKDIAWGILTNGRYYILMNNTIKGNSSQKEILRYYLIKPTKENLKDYPYSQKFNNNCLKYFTFEYLFENKTTNYYKHLVDLKNHMESHSSSYNKTSWRQYKSTLSNFIEYLSSEFNTYDLKSFITPYYFNKFLLYDINHKKNNNLRYSNTNDTIINKYAHVRGLCEILKRNNDITTNPFEEISEEEMIKNFSFEDDPKEFPLLTNYEIQALLDYYDNTRHAERNKLILLLFLCTGADIKKIKQIKDSDIDFKNRILLINNVKVPLGENILILAKSLIDYKKDNNIKFEYLFYSKRRNTYKILVDTSFNEIITKQFNKLDIAKNRKNKLTTSFIKYCVIRGLYINGISVEDISKLTNLSLESTKKYLDINDSKNLKNLMKKHPYREFVYSEKQSL